MLRPADRRRLTSSTALAAALAFAPSAAHAQAFQGTPTVQSGNVTFNRNTPGIETITVDSAVAVVNWAPSDVSGTGPVNFLPGGNTATFQNGVSTGDYVILNRILPTDVTRAIGLNGTVNSLLNGQTGGQVWFYSPGGLLIGATAVFNIGSLLLSAGDPVLDSFGSPIDANGLIRLNATTNSVSAVKIAAGAQITAPAEGSYVIIGAPRVVQDGLVRVNGQAAYIAAESVDITVNNGLFDISVNQSSFVDAAVAGDNLILSHTGSTTGPASTGASDPHGIYLVSQARDVAIQTLLQVNGNLGFDAAASATVENGAIVLNGGGFILNGQDGGVLTGVNGVRIASSDIKITGAGNVTSDLQATATRTAEISTSGAATIAFAQDVRLNVFGAGEFAATRIAAAGTSTISVGGDVFLSGGGEHNLDSVNGSELNVAATADMIIAPGARIDVTGFASLDATGFGGAGFAAAGGRAAITSAGTVSIGGGASLSAIGTGASDSSAAAGTVPASSATGGQASISTSAGGAVSISGAATLSAMGTGGDSTLGGAGGAGTGGQATIVNTGGAISIGGAALNAVGNGGQGATGGGGAGGLASIDTVGAVTIAGVLTAQANGFGGLSNSGGLAGSSVGGSAIVRAGSGGSVTVSNVAIIQAVGQSLISSATGASIPGPGNATGGTATINADGGVISIGGLLETAIGTGGSAVGGASRLLASAGGSVTVTGPGVPVQNPNGTTVSNLILAAGGGGGGISGGSGRGGTVLVDASGGGSISVLQNLFLGAGGTGGVGSSGSGGDGIGGAVTVSTNGGTVALGAGTTTPSNVTMVASGLSGFGPTPGAVTGGSVSVFAKGGPLTVGNLFQFADPAIATGAPLHPAFAAGAVDFQADGVALTINGFASVETEGAFTIRGLNGGFLRAAGVSADAGVATVDLVGAAPAGNPAIVRAGQFDIATTGDFTATGVITANDFIDITAGGAITVGDLTATNFDVDLDAQAGVTAGRLRAGDSVSITSHGAVNVIEASGGILPSSDPDYTGNVGVDAIGAITIGTAAARSNVAIRSATSTITTGALTSLDNVILLGGGAIITGAIVAGGTGGIDIDGQRGILYVGAPTQLPSIDVGVDAPDVLAMFTQPAQATGGDVSLGAVSATGRVDIAAGGVFTAPSLAAVDRIRIVSAGDLTLGVAGATTTTAAGIVSLTSNLGSIILLGDLLLSGASTATTEPAISLTAALDVAGGGARVRSASAFRGAITGKLTVASLESAGNSDGFVGGDLTVTDLFAVGAGVAGVGGAINISIGRVQVVDGASVSFVSSNGNVSIGTIGGAGLGAPGAVSLGATGSVTVGSLTGGPVSINAGGVASVTAPGALTIADASAATLVLDAGGALAITGAVAGGEVSLASTDLQIGASGSIDASDLLLTSRNAAVQIGGAGGPAGAYVLDAAEAQSINAGRVTFKANGAGQALPAVTLADLTLGGPLAPGGGASFVRLETPGTISITGQIDYLGADAETRFELSAGQQIRVITPGGGIAMRGAGQALAGTLSLEAGTILIADQAAAADVDEANSFTARRTRLEKIASGATPAGFVQAGAIRFAVGNALLVQNSGDATTDAGVTAGAGGISVVNLTDGGRIGVVLNGRIANADGSFVTNDDLLGQVSFDPAAAEDTITFGSAVNGCLILGGGCAGGSAETIPEIREPGADKVTALGSLIDAIDVPEETASGEPAPGGGGATTRAPNIVTATLLDFAPLTVTDEIDTPVTGAGNEELWDAGQDLSESGGGGN